MTFHIGQQNAGVANNVAGDQRIEGGQQGTVVTSRDARRAVRELRDALAATALDETSAAEAHAQIAQIDAALQEQHPDKHRVAARLERLTRMLSDVGSLTTASAALIGPLHTLAGWLGALGAPILSMLPG